jgi:hypothetical protein
VVEEHLVAVVQSGEVDVAGEIVGLLAELAGALLMKWNFLVMAIGLFIIVVGFVGFCPVYALFGISTRKRGS